MALIDPKQLRQNATNRRRGLILHFLYISSPKPVEFSSLIFLLDKHNNPVSARRLAEDLDFLRGPKLIRVFPVGADSELNSVEQAKLIQRYCDSEGELDDHFAASITTRGINFQEGVFDEAGITRVG
ncbi:MAG: hypothetical protein IPM50_09405 [Acidobacteriota bacterium]|jgi:hypothetical protein|nr:MAG: hypothetical protein IPM50_09405 [Acidobacteriota bacterium]